MIEKVAAAAGSSVSRETMERLEHYVHLLLDENNRQNLIAASTAEDVWMRHVVDSAQLLRFMPAGRHLDVGSGAGLPGLVLTILSEAPITMVEPRRLRAEFLQRCINELDLRHATVQQAKVERVSGKFDTITARAVAAIERLFAVAHHLSHPQTVWVLPKGRSGQMELAAARSSWQGHFRTEPSITEGEAVIVIASGVSPRRKGRG
ncbi:16S rRNA (guanine(527)-N(7))-methyltransferase RsmG [Sphingomonas sp. KRR8]|uniref:16S rRNA (guanine(527)-N(7))-methyltransferase RsmG n=1 Tax=Sphingomonas sp. KRR8 TaxID=2942996 RepID=UPI002021B306|nr:16S rRNA (guanine(527)-N(7))-methyltransferase RsmG [Sphingomonas sp. KRR8]URD60196.1 16S rRNA (guanine(527)-N(7))-methyltransferase RsmG [Sphingomonas sp. KRR8]